MRRTIVHVVVLLILTIVAARASADELLSRVITLSEQVTPNVVQWRREIHTHPELPNREVRTAALVAEQLKALGVDEVRPGVAHTGVVALIRGRLPGRTVALRADMDALPIEEQTGLPFASQTKGVMHACGHDAHTAILLGAAYVLVQLRDRLPGNVKLLFQPAEEGAPAGEEGGARLMIKEGALQNPDVAAIFALHINPEQATGRFSYRDGVLLASVDRFRIRVIGKQSHGAQPWLGVDPVVASAHIITALQTIASRHIDARQPVVVSVGAVRALGAWNVIPGEVALEGTVRTHDNAVRQQVSQLFQRIVQDTAAAHGVTAEIDYSDYGPVLSNDAALGVQVRASLASLVGAENLAESVPGMGGEDFAHYVSRVPGYYIFLGVRNETIRAVRPLHTPDMILDEAALPFGIRAMAMMALDYLRGQ
jgi:amidohydrolase